MSAAVRASFSGGERGFGRVVSSCTAPRCGDDNTSDQAFCVLVLSLRSWMACLLFLTPLLGRQQCMLYHADLGEQCHVAVAFARLG